MAGVPRDAAAGTLQSIGAPGDMIPPLSGARKAVAPQVAIAQLQSRNVCAVRPAARTWARSGGRLRSQRRPVSASTLAARPAEDSWRVDETYVKIRGKWVYLYRAVDRDGKTVDFRLSARRDVATAKTFFRKAIKSQGSTPRTITLDGYAASHRAVRDMKVDGQLPADTKLRSSKYLNNLIEQDHLGVKLRIDPMLGFKWFGTAAITIAGIELLRRIHKGQFNIGRLCVKDRRAPAVWNAVLAAR